MHGNFSLEAMTNTETQTKVFFNKERCRSTAPKPGLFSSIQLCRLAGRDQPFRDHILR